MKQIHKLGPKVAITIKVVRDIKKAGQRMRKVNLSPSEIEGINTSCGPLLLNLTVFPSEERQPLVVVGDIEQLSRQKGTLHMDFTFMTRKYSFLCLTERFEYAFFKKGDKENLAEGRRGFTWCISLSERKDSHAIKFILTTIKTQVLLKTGNDFSPARIVIDFDQGNFPSFSSFIF